MSFLPAESTKAPYMFRAGNQADFWARLAVVIVVVFPRLLGAVFVLAGATKLLRPAGLMGVLQYDGIPNWLVGPVGYTVITLELRLGLLLIVMPRSPVGDPRLAGAADRIHSSAWLPLAVCRRPALRLHRVAGGRRAKGASPVAQFA